MRIHKEGNITILITAILITGLNYVFFKFIPLVLISYILLLVSMVFFLFIISFFRKPDRAKNISENSILAPADGTLVTIEEVEEPEFFKDKRKQISIFMSPLNVHINWAPVNGIVSYYKYHPGKHLVAWHPKSSTNNERTTIVFKNAKGEEILVRQIAGAVARRVVCYAEENKNFKQGDEIGFIKFGSRVDLFLPLDAEIKVKLDQKIIGNKTIIAN